MILETEITINSSPDRVWTVLTDFPSYPIWNPFVLSLTGEVKVGETIQVTLQAPASKKMKFTPQVLNFDRNKEFRWKGKLFIKGIFDGEHVFELKDDENGKTQFIHKEIFSGILVPLFKTKLLTNTRQGFQAMNEALKRRCENS